MIKDMQNKDFEPAEIALFKSQYMTVFQQLSELEKQKKKLEEEAKNIKKQFEKVMDECGIKSINNQYITITRVAAVPGKTTVDLEAFAKAEPENYAELLADYPKQSGGKSAYVAFKVK